MNQTDLKAEILRLAVQASGEGGDAEAILAAAKLFHAWVIEPAEKSEDEANDWSGPRLSSLLSQ